MSAIEKVIEELRSFLPPVFAGSALGDLTGQSINWRTIQNRRSKREIPEKCFVRSGKKVLVLRDPFLEYWRGTLSEARPLSD